MNENKVKKTYVKPGFEVVNMELEKPLLDASAPNFGDGGIW